MRKSARGCTSSSLAAGASSADRPSLCLYMVLPEASRETGERPRLVGRFGTVTCNKPYKDLVAVPTSPYHYDCQLGCCECPPILPPREHNTQSARQISTGQGGQRRFGWCSEWPGSLLKTAGFHSRSVAMRHCGRLPHHSCWCCCWWCFLQRSLNSHCQPTPASAEYGWPEIMVSERACSRLLSHFRHHVSLQSIYYRLLAPGSNRFAAGLTGSTRSLRWKSFPRLLQSWAAAKTAGETALLGQLPILWVDGKPFAQSAVRCGLPAPRHILPALPIKLCQLHATFYQRFLSNFASSTPHFTSASHQTLPARHTALCLLDTVVIYAVTL
jgi:hypothetical protein